MAHMGVDPKVLCDNYFTIEKHVGENRFLQRPCSEREFGSTTIYDESLLSFDAYIIR